MLQRTPRIKEKQEFEQRVIEIARVTRVMAGGKRMRFRACVAIGDEKGKIGYAIAKGADVTLAINKAIRKAKKGMIKVKIADDTIPHVSEVKYKAAHILLKPAPQGTGIIAGGPVRAVLELTGIKDIVSKMLGSHNKINNVQAVFKALGNLRDEKSYKEIKGEKMK